MKPPSRLIHRTSSIVHHTQNSHPNTHILLIQTRDNRHPSLSCTYNSQRRHYAARAPRTLLVDGTPLICRSFHGTKQEMSTVDGVPTNGVLTYVRTLIRSMPADYYDYAAVFFESKNNFRKGLMESYKGTREKQDDRLVMQFPIAIEATRLMNVHCESQDTFEADDLIASYTKKCYEAGHMVHILTNDKDLYQMVNERVHVINIRDGLYDRQRIIRKFGVPPEKFIMYQALIGDQVDNIPGIPGIGKKTGMDITQQFESIDDLIQNVERVENPKIRASIKNNIAQLRLSTQLVTLRTDLETKSLDEMRVPSTVKNPAFLEFLEKYEFNSILHTLNAAPKLSKAAKKAAKQKRQQMRRTAQESGIPLMEATTTADLFGNEASSEKVVNTSKRRSAAPKRNAAAVSENDTPVGASIAVPEVTTPPSLLSDDIHQTHSIDPKLDVVNNYLPGYRSLLTISQARRYLDEAIAAPHVAIKTLISSEDVYDNVMIGISLSFRPGESVYIPFLEGDIPSNYFEAVEAVKKSDTFRMVRDRLLQNPDIKKVGVDMKREIKNLASYDTKVSNFDDAMVMSYVLNCGKHLHDLPDLMVSVLGITDIKTVLIDRKIVLGMGSKKVPFSQAPLIPVTNYVCQLSDYALRSFNALDPELRKLKKLHKFYLKLEKPLVSALAGVEMRGAVVNIEAFQKLQIEYDKKIEEMRAKILEECGEPDLNINSPQQLGEILFDRLKIGLEFAKKSSKVDQYVVNVDVLNALAKRGHKIAEHILEYRALIKLQSTYILGLQKHINPYTHRIHPTYMNCLTVTGRLSCTEPNLQNIPNRTQEGREIRKLFVAPPGHCLMKVDYSQVELRILAHIAKIDVLRDAFRNGADIHSTTAASIFNKPLEEVQKEERQKAKSINFGIIYGMSEFGLSKQIDVSVAEAKEYIEQYFKRYPGIKNYMQKASDFCHKHGFVQTFFGRRCWVPGINSSYQNVQSFAERTSINTPIQGSSADITKMAMVRLYEMIKERGMRTRMIMQVHDEIVFEVPMDEKDAAAQLIKEAMEAADTLLGKTFSIPLPVDVDICKNWVEKMTPEEMEVETKIAMEMTAERERRARMEEAEKERLEREEEHKRKEQLELRRQQIQARRYSMAGGPASIEAPLNGGASHGLNGSIMSATALNGVGSALNGHSRQVDDFDPEPVARISQKRESTLRTNGILEEDEDDDMDIDDNPVAVLNGHGRRRAIVDEEDESDLEDGDAAFLNPTANPPRNYESEEDEGELDELELTSRVIGMSRPYQSDDEDEDELDALTLDDVRPFRAPIQYESDDDDEEEVMLRL